MFISGLSIVFFYKGTKNMENGKRITDWKLLKSAKKLSYQLVKRFRKTDTKSI